MKYLLLYFFLFGCAFRMLAQQAAPSPSVPPLPGGPFLKRAPDFSTWTVNCTGNPTAGGGLAASGTAAAGQDQQKQRKQQKQKEGPVSKLTVVKTGSKMVEFYVDADGQRHEIWHVGGLRIVVQLGDGPLIFSESAKTALLSPDYGGGDIYSINFSSSDFAGLEWLSPSTYSGIVKYQGSDCIVFKGSVSPLSAREQMLERVYIEQSRAMGQSVPDALKVPAVAYIDLATRLPHLVQFGDEKCVYQYDPSPPAELQLPPELAGPAKEYEQRIARLSAPASRPF